MKLLLLVIAVLALAGCSTTQVNEGTQWAAGQLITLVLHAAFDDDDDEPPEYVPSAKAYCDKACREIQEARAEAYVAEIQRRERRAEARAFKAEFDDFMRQLEEAERASGDAPTSVVTLTSEQRP